MGTTIPVIDIGEFSGRADAAGNRIAAEIGAACENIGFLLIEGHGIAPAVIDGLHSAGRRFFDLPEAVKSEYETPGFFGYQGMESGSLGYSLDDEDALPDLREGFGAGNEDIDPASTALSAEALRQFYDPIRYPREIEGFESAWLAYYRAVSGLAERIMRIFAIALDLPPDYFDACMREHVSNLALYNYPDLEHTPAAGQLRGAPHTDFGSLTIVHSDWSVAGGLQVLSDGRWIDVPAARGAFVVNLGDMMARWTNDRWVSTLHRVANPDVTGGSARRQSAVYFHIPNPDWMVECIPTCKAPGQAPKYEPITIGEHHLRKLGKMFEPAR